MGWAEPQAGQRISSAPLFTPFIELPETPFIGPFFTSKAFEDMELGERLNEGGDLRRF